MRPRAVRQRWAPLLVGLLAAALAPDARADWARDYDLGVRAIEQGDWKEAERYMRAAIDDAPEAVSRKRFQGQRFDRYLPHWYAGLAAFRQGDCARALEYWDNASSRRVLADISELSAELDKLGGECQTRLAATAKPEPAVPATTAARPATPTGRAVARQDPPARSAPKEPAAPPRQAAPAPARRVAAPPALRSALDAWLSGRYEQLARVDSPASLDARARSQLLLLRAAARFVQSELDGDAAALEAARADVRAARQAATLSPDPSLFPPRFRAFATRVR